MAFAGLLIVGVLLALPLAIGICATLGAVLMAVDWLTSRCPGCGQQQMRWTNGIRETYPTGRGTGSFYLCRSCGGRWFWSNDDRGWEDASSPDRAWAFVEAHGGRAR
jgi:hypothetical protein